MIPPVVHDPAAMYRRSTPSGDIAAAEPSSRPSVSTWRNAGTALGAAKWAAAAGALAGAAGLSASAAIACAAGAAALGGVVWTAEAVSLRYGYLLPHATLQHALCNELHTLAGGLLGAAPVAAGLTALAAALATPDADGIPQAGYNGLAFLTATVACPAVALLTAACRAAPVDPASGLRQLMVYGLPLLATGAVLVTPALALQAAVSPEAASRFVIAFGAGMACAAVREGLTQATTRAWGGLERDGHGASYGLSQAQGADRAASTVTATAASCLMFAATTGLLVHQLDAWCGLGMAPAGQSVLAMSAGEAARRTALRYLVMVSTNELLEGVARCLPLAVYARARGITLRYRDNGAGIREAPAQLRRNLADAGTLRRAALFASARTLDGALVNLLSQLAAAAAPGVFWNGYRVAAVLVQGATMARTPIVAAWLLPSAPGAGTATEADVARLAGHGGEVTVVVANESEADSGNDGSGSAASSPDPLSDPTLQWA